MRYHFCGIAGSGMCSIAQFLVKQSISVSGSDRAFDAGRSSLLKQKFISQGIKIFPQDGSGIEADVTVVASTAVESKISDLIAANELQLPMLHRSDILAKIFHQQNGIAVAGTCGKSTVTAILGWLLFKNDFDPAVINGAEMVNFKSDETSGHSRFGLGQMVIEADESDGSLIKYQPKIGLINNISKDHKTIAELLELFSQFAAQSEHVVINLDCQNIAKLDLDMENVTTFSIKDPTADVYCQPLKSDLRGETFIYNDEKFFLPIAGKHNISNAAAALATIRQMAKIELPKLKSDLAEFAGVGRRMEIIGEAKGRLIIDDFAHNPEKIAAIISTIKSHGKQLRVFLQLHGFGPAKFMEDELYNVLQDGLTATDTVVLTEAYYAGGTVNSEYSVKNLANRLDSCAAKVYFELKREDIKNILISDSMVGDVILILGARDPSLNDFAKDVYHQLREV